ncbi:NUMOD4 domain-containing protein [Tuberibacillus sp. Marseille-P3662]|uniref:NUMOD4 domain-containing protein n=1 Tax=Tuberibacillus sp. Marseille-P3662 TaxID=1965358 RepID=UPI0015938EFB|nr:NUMOD4 domain-containing protein [Tuberibacillus sp. Marseille-P3662]
MEIWKDIEGYEGFYQVSNKGRVKRLPGTVWNGRGFAKKSGGILKQSKTRGDYLMVSLCKDNESRLFRVNRLVASAFIPNPDLLPHVGHNDDNKKNNVVVNLYWTDAKENNTHNGKHLRVGEKLSKRVIGIKEEERIEFNSTLEAGKNGYNASAIRNCLTGRAKTHKGYRWEYA